MARIKDEVPPLPVVLPEPARVRGVAANDGVFRWKLVAGLASLAAVGVLTWQVVAQQPSSTGPQLAAAPVAPEPASSEVVVSGSMGPVIRDQQLDDLLAAHRQLGGSALQMPAGFLRNATFETPQR
jgi:sigma-E factor negative regulatory protein RseA